MIHLIRNEYGNPIGWEMKPITPQEQEIAASIRDLQFFGFDDTYPVYDGLELIEPQRGKIIGNIKSLKWVMKRHQKTT